MRPPVRLLGLVAVLELVSVVVLLVNLVTVHLPLITSGVGPLHGLAYVTVVVLALLVEDRPLRARLLALIPAVGGILVLRAFRRTG